MNELKVTLDRGELRPKEKISGKVSWRVSTPVRYIELRLFWYTIGKGSEDVGVVDTLRIEDVAQAGTRGFSFILPASPYSFSGRLISLVWAVEALVEPGRECQRAEFTFAPSGKEVLLYAQSQG